MMKKPYGIPAIEITPFLFADILTTSGLGEGDAGVDELDDIENPNPWPNM